MPEPLVIDLSHHNTVTSFTSVRYSGIAGVIQKVSQGTSYKDPTYVSRCAAASAAGLLVGRYHFGDGSNVDAQVKNFLAGWQPNELLALDWEDNADSQMLLGQARDFVSKVQAQTGVWPVLYSGNTLKEALAVKGANPGPLPNCRLWLTQIGPQAVLPPGWDSYWLWQYSWTGSIPGITGDVDLNTYAGSGVDQLATEWYGEMGPVPIPPEPPPEPEPEITTVSLSWPAGVPVKLVVSGKVVVEQG